MLVYLDSAPIIYLVEQNPAFSPPVVTKLAGLGGQIVSSDLAGLECVIVPYRANDIHAVADFQSFFQTRLSAIFGLDWAVFDRAATIRSVYPFRTPDALHLAVAVLNKCDLFLTNDSRLQRFTGIRVEVI